MVFQSLVIEFDLTKPKKPLIGVAPRNPLYVPTAPGQVDALKIPLIKRDARGIYVEDPRRDKFRHGVDHVPVVMGIGYIYRLYTHRLYVHVYIYTYIHYI